MASANRLYYEPARSSGLSTLLKIRAAAAAVGRKGTPESVDVIRAWLEKAYAYTLRGPVRKRFAHNPYTVTNMMDVLENDLLDLQTYAKHNDHNRYNLSVIDVLPKFLYLTPAKTNSGTAVAPTFRSIFDDLDDLKYSRRTVWI